MSRRPHYCGEKTPLLWREIPTTVTRSRSTKLPDMLKDKDQKWPRTRRRKRIDSYRLTHSKNRTWILAYTYSDNDTKKPPVRKNCHRTISQRYHPWLPQIVIYLETKAPTLLYRIPRNTLGTTRTLVLLKHKRSTTVWKIERLGHPTEQHLNTCLNAKRRNRKQTLIKLPPAFSFLTVPIPTVVTLIGEVNSTLLHLITLLT